MGPLGFVVRKPVTVLVGVILVALFGALAAFNLPIQLTPNVDRPLITVTTTWEGASPLEVEREIVDEQEDKLKGIPGMAKMTSTAVEGRATVELEFRVGTDTSRALLEVSEKLRQVPSYPENVDEPVAAAGETEGSDAIAWFILKRTPGSEVDEEDLPFLRTMVEERVKPVMERAHGVATVGVVGGREQEVHVKVDPVRLAARHLSLMDVRDAIRRRNTDISAGNLEQGKRDLTIRTVGKFGSLEEIEDLVLARRQGRMVQLADVGRAEIGFKEPETIVRSLGRPAIAVNATRQSGTNVLKVMESLKEAVAEANRQVLRPRGLELQQVYDQTTYIYSAIDLVTQNLWVGGLLAISVLLLFLRSGRSMLVVAVAIPVSVTGSFMALALLGRNLNVVSLAGLAFAVGMVVDNSIVVLENIYRHRQMGKRAHKAAVDGGREVWGAVLASTLTTLAVFIPVTFVEEEAGQLFRDIAIAISAAVGLSLLVSVFFIPMAASRLVPGGDRSSRRDTRMRRLADTLLLGPLGRGFAEGVARLVGWLNRRTSTRLLAVVGITGAAVLIAVVLMPPMTYLPQGNQNLVIGFLIPPPGYNEAELVRIGKSIEKRLTPYWKVVDGGELTPEERFPPWYQGEEPLPGIPNFFYVARGQAIFMGAQSDDPTNVRPLVDLFQYAAADIPGVFVFAVQRSLFERGITSGNSIDLEVVGNRMEEVQAAAGALFGAIAGRMGPPRPEPSNFNLGAPEFQVKVDEVRASELGVSVSDLGFMVQALIDGAVVSDYRHEGETIDLKLMSLEDGGRDVSRLDELTLYTPAGRKVPLASVAGVVQTTSPNEILHLEERRGVKLIVTPPEGMELSRAMDVLQEEVIAPMRGGGALPEDVSTKMAGTADKLVATRDALGLNFLLAVVITYLLLSALFESFLYPVVIMISVPLASVGGILGLRIVHHVTGQQMDVLTMLGFVILVGTVVNNAILIVHQALNHIREEGTDPKDAVMQSVRTRVRPIFMSTSTSVLGMIPLVLFPGAGSELYRGLGSVVVGGLIASTFFTLLVVPTLFSLLLSAKRKAVEGLGRLRADA